MPANEKKRGLLILLKVDENVIITTSSDAMTLNVDEVRGKQVRVRFIAPKSFNIARESVFNPDVAKESCREVR